MNATKVTPYFFASEALEEPVGEVIAFAMSPASAFFVMASVTSNVGASVVATGDCAGSVAATDDCVLPLLGPLGPPLPPLPPLLDVPVPLLGDSSLGVPFPLLGVPVPLLGDSWLGVSFPLLGDSWLGFPFPLLGVPVPLPAYLGIARFAVMGDGVGPELKPLSTNAYVDVRLV